MKLIIGGASGFVATEIIRQSLSIPKITSVIAVARRAIATPSNLGRGADASKFRSVILDNYDRYPDDVKKQLAGADACIWYVRRCNLLALLMISTPCLHRSLLGKAGSHYQSKLKPSQDRSHYVQ